MRAISQIRFLFSDIIPDFFRSNLGKQVLGYTLFYIVLWALHLIIISLVSFFHLLLDHNIRIIGDWIGDRGWTLIIISKLLVLYIGMQFVNLRANKLVSIKSYFHNSIQIPRIEMFVALLFLLIALCGVGQVGLNPKMIFEFNRLLLSAIGTFILFSVDYLLIIVLDIFYPVRDETNRMRRIFLFPLLFYFFTGATFIYELTISFKLYSLFLLLMYVSEWRRRNWTLPLLFLVAFIVPCFTLIGLDPVWGEVYSPYFTAIKISSFMFLLLTLFAIGYLQYHLKKKPEYIYRD